MLAIFAAFAPATWAQVATGDTGTAARLPFKFVPGISASQTYSHSDAVTPGSQRSDLVTQISPSIQLSSGSGRVRGFLNYALNSYTYARDHSQNNVQQALNTSFNVEAIPNFAFIDASASISQQATSPFGQQFADGSVATSNRSEVLTYAVSPYVRGTVAGLVDYEGRLSRVASRGDKSSLANSASTTASASLSGSTAFTALRWTALASRQIVDFNAGQNYESDRVNLGLSYALTPQFMATLQGGRESNDFVGTGKQSAATAGLGFVWRPSEVTSLSANVDRRSFGRTHALAFNHRTGRTVWSYTDTRSVTSGVGQPVLASLGSTYDLYYPLFVRNYPDPAERELQFNKFLSSLGQSANSAVIGGFLTSALTLQRIQALSAGLQGVRDTLTLTFTRSESGHVDQLVAVPDALAGSALIRQQGVNLNLTHRLTPTASLSVTLAQQRTAGTAGPTGGTGVLPSSRLSSLYVSWSDQIGRYTRASLSARRGVFDSATVPYTESAAIASVSFQF